MHDAWPREYDRIIGLTARGLVGELLFGLAELVIGVTEEDEAQHGNRILSGLQLRVGPQIVGCGPEALFFQTPPSAQLKAGHQEALTCGEDHITH